MWHKEKEGDNVEGEEKGQGREYERGGSAVTGAEAEKICKRLHKNEIATKTQR